MWMLMALMLPASAGEVVVERRGLTPAHVWIDAEAKGKATKKRPVSAELPEGPHEVWVSMEPNATVTRCHGVVDVPASGAVTVRARDMGCDGFNDAFPDGPTAFRGASVRFLVDSAVDAWVSVDGGPSLALPSMPFLLNLSPGGHSIVLYRDVHRESVFAQGSVTLDAGQQAAVTCTTAGCTGFDQPPITIIRIDERPSLRLNINVDL